MMRQTIFDTQSIFSLLSGKGAVAAPVSIEGIGTPGEYRVATRQHRPDTDDG
jgi:hypothetical protein